MEYFCSLTYYSVVCYDLDSRARGQALRAFLSCVLPLFDQLHLIWIKLVRKLHRQVAYDLIIINLTSILIHIGCDHKQMLTFFLRSVAKTSTALVTLVSIGAYNKFHRLDIKEN